MSLSDCTKRSLLIWVLPLFSFSTSFGSLFQDTDIYFFFSISWLDAFLLSHGTVISISLQVEFTLSLIMITCLLARICLSVCTAISQNTACISLLVIVPCWFLNNIIIITTIIIIFAVIYLLNLGLSSCSCRSYYYYFCCMTLISWIFFL